MTTIRICAQDDFKAELEKPNKTKRYRLKDLLKSATPRNIQSLNQSTQWAREGTSQGRELS